MPLARRLQFHTPESMETKMGRSHHLYEQVRSPKLPQAERVALCMAGAAGMPHGAGG